jgi:hypothetical protein
MEDNMEVATPACREMAVLMKADVIVIVMADRPLWRICIQNWATFFPCSMLSAASQKIARKTIAAIKTTVLSARVMVGHVPIDLRAGCFVRGKLCGRSESATAS